jgi:carboxylesterase type B
MVAQGHPNPHPGRGEHHFKPTAHISNGTVNGRYLANFDQDLFLGIPFANAPRLANLTPINASWTTPFDASSYGPTCDGFGSNQLLPSVKDDQSEECLNLNIIRPSSLDADTKLPVLLWIYGGGWRYVYQGATG